MGNAGGQAPANTTVPRLERDGLIAVLYSPGFGAGWSTWADDEQREGLCLDAEIAQAVLDGDRNKAVKIAKAKYGGFYDGGARDLKVAWLLKGVAFQIEEYDGSETIQLREGQSWLTA